jgi:hypothetical protein
MLSGVSKEDVEGGKVRLLSLMIEGSTWKIQLAVLKKSVSSCRREIREEKRRDLTCWLVLPRHCMHKALPGGVVITSRNSS